MPKALRIHLTKIKYGNKKAPEINGSFFLRFLFNKAVNVAVEFVTVVFVFANFFVDKRSDKDNVRKDIKPEHEDDHRSKGTVNCGIFYGRAYEPGEESAYYGENK